MTIFSAIDLHSAYQQVPMDLESIEKTTATTPFGAFKYRRMNFGLCNATQSFQRFINKVISGMENFCFAYVDDLLVASTDAEEHKSHLRMLFQRLADYGLIINAKKSQIGQYDLEFLGHRITKKGLRPLQSRVEAICSFPRPSNVTQLRSFLGMVNFYRRFISHISGSLRHLNMMLSNKKKGSTKELDWKPEAIQAFEHVKSQLGDQTLLCCPKINTKFSLICDGSSYGVGASLNQLDEGKLKPVAFFCKTSDAAQRKYSTFDRELLAVFLSLKHFKLILQGRDLNIVIDHQPLVKAF